MANLENSMFVLPDRFAVQGGEMYVRFPTEFVPKDRGVRGLWLHFPLPGGPDAVVLHVREAESAWDEEAFAQGARPMISPRLLAVAGCMPFHAEDAVAIDPVLEKWMYREGNFGLQVSHVGEGFAFDPARPPYLEIVYEPARERVV